MTTTPMSPTPDDDNEHQDPSSGEESQSTSGDAVGAEIGMSEGEGSTFEPEEDDQVPD